MKKFYFIFILILPLIFHSRSASSTDLVVTDIYFSNELFEYGDVPILAVPPKISPGLPVYAVIENQNVLTASNYTVKFFVLQENSNGEDVDTLFTDIKERTNLAPYSADTVMSELWGQTSTRFEVIVKVEFNEDIKLSNNEKNEIFYGIRSSLEAAENAEEHLKSEHPELVDEDNNITATGFLKPETLVEGDVISHEDLENQTISYDTIKVFSWLFYVPHFVSDKFVQPAEFVVVDATTGEVTSTSIESPLYVNEIPFLSGSWEKIDSENLVFGPEPVVEIVEDIGTVHEEKEVTPEEKDSVCVIMISGEEYSASDATSFFQDHDFMKKNLIMEAYGPKLKQEQITSYNAVPPSQLRSILANVKGDCDIIYFYYTGHGFKGGMDLFGSEEDMWYSELADLLYKTGAKEFKVIIDACHSGSAEGAFRESNIFIDRDLTLITSSSSIKLSYTKNVLTTSEGIRYNPGFFSYNFLKCFGDPRADTDGDGKTSLQEAYYCLRNDNPVLSKGSLNNAMNPQLIEHRAYRAEEDGKTVNVPEYKIEINFKEELDEDAVIVVGENQNIEDTSTDDETITEFATNRYYTIKMLNQLNTFNADITFPIDPEVDNIPDGEGEIAVVKRDSAGSKWEKLNSEYDTENNKITAKDVTGFSDFAFALIVEEDINTNLIDNNVKPEDSFTVYPNPAQDYLKLEFNSVTEEEIRVSIYDLSGRELKADLFSAVEGINIFKINIKEITLKQGRGLYMIRLTFGKGVYSSRFLIE